MNQVGHLYFHSPCFDGIVSSVLAWDFLETRQGWSSAVLHSVNYDVREAWLSTPLEHPCAIVDFLYHPKADFWADHHLTTFLNEEAQIDFQRRRNPWLIYDVQKGSCASLLWNHFRTALDYQNPRFQVMVEWAEKVDSASYESVEEAIFGDAPALRIRLSLTLKGGKALSEELITALRRDSLEQVASLPIVNSRFEEARSLISAGLTRFRESARMEDGGIVVFDVDATDVIVSRYAPYYFFPDACYSMGIFRSPKGASITAMRNPWRDVDSLSLGTIFEKFGGGGHQRVAAVFLPGPDASKAGSILEELKRELRRLDRVQREGATS